MQISEKSFAIFANFRHQISLKSKLFAFFANKPAKIPVLLHFLQI